MLYMYGNITTFFHQDTCIKKMTANNVWTDSSLFITDQCHKKLNHISVLLKLTCITFCNYI